MNEVIEIIRRSLPAKRKPAAGGWESFNCVACQPMGESRADTRSRGGIMFTPTGGFAYNCFNCGLTIHWEPGRQLRGKKANILLRGLGLSFQEINEVTFKSWLIRDNTETDPEEIIKKYSREFCPEFKEMPLPEGALSFEEWAEVDNPPTGFINAAEYVNSRGSYFLGAHTYYWTKSLKKSFHKRVIIPFYWKNKIVGYTGRLITKQLTKEEPKYLNQFPHNYLFNNRVMYINERQYLILVEGVFDAIAIDGLALLGSSLTDDQIKWINPVNKEVIFVPDRNKASYKIIDIAISQKWSVSFPYWEEGIDDVASATKRYGHLYTLISILKSQTSYGIEPRWKLWFKGKKA